MSRIYDESIHYGLTGEFWKPPYTRDELQAFIDDNRVHDVVMFQKTDETERYRCIIIYLGFLVVVTSTYFTEYEIAHIYVECDAKIRQFEPLPFELIKGES